MIAYFASGIAHNLNPADYPSLDSVTWVADRVEGT